MHYTVKICLIPMANRRLMRVATSPHPNCINPHVFFLYGKCNSNVTLWHSPLHDCFYLTWPFYSGLGKEQSYCMCGQHVLGIHLRIAVIYFLLLITQCKADQTILLRTPWSRLWLWHATLPSVRATSHVSSSTPGDAQICSPSGAPATSNPPRLNSTNTCGWGQAYGVRLPAAGTSIHCYVPLGSI